MSEIPATNERIISELYGYSWSDDYDSEAVEHAIGELFEKRPDLNEFCDWVRREYAETAYYNGGRPVSWRDFRDQVARDYLIKQFDYDEIESRIEHLLRQ